MTRHSLVARWLLTAMLLFAVLFGAVGQSLARVEAAPVSTPTASLVGVYIPDTLPLVAPEDYDLSLEMSIPSSDQFPNVNETVTFTIKVANEGTIPVTGVVVQDILPTGLTFKSADSNTYDPTTGIWVVGTVAVNATVQLKINAVVMQTGTIENMAEILFTDLGLPDFNPDNNSDSEVINPKLADLSITKTVDNPTPNKGDTVKFTLTVSNAGPAVAENITVKDKLPDGLVYLSDSDGGTTYNPGTGIWSVGTLLASGTGASDMIVITARMDTNAALTNVAEVWTSDQYDNDSMPGNGVPTEDDYAKATITPPSANLRLTKSIDNPVPNAANQVTFTITVTNSGPDKATGVLVKDLLSPSDFTYVSDNGGGSYVPSTGIWTVGELAKDASASLRIIAIAESNTPGTNWAEIWKVNEYDPNSIPGNQSTTEDDDDGAPFADLSIVKSASAQTVGVGSNVEFTITINNAGPGKASNVTVEDKLPTGLAFVSSVGTGTYIGDIWDVGLMPPNSSATLKIIALADSVGTVTNKAEVKTSKQADPDSKPGNNSTTEDDDDSVVVNIPTSVKTVVITEIAWMGTAASSNDEWIELYNTTNKPVDLTGWHIRSFRPSGGDTVYIDIPLVGIIPPRSYYLMERIRDDAVSDIDADYVYPATISGKSTQLSNSGELLLLCSPQNMDMNVCRQTVSNLPSVVVDIVNLPDHRPGTPASSTSNPWPAGSASTYGSMERKNLISNEDTNWFTHTGVSPRWGEDANGNNIKGTPKHDNWAFNVTATPRATATRTRTPTPFPQPAPVLVINEFLARPGHDWNQDGVVNTYDEFIEVMNAGKVSLNLASYKLDDYEQDANGVEIKNGFTLPSRTLAPGQIAVFYASDTGIFLSDAGDTVRLVKASNYTVVDSYTYPPVRSRNLSWCRYTDGYGSWLGFCFPTPGQRNSLTGDLYPPEPGGSPSKVCLLPDNAPEEFLLAECEQGGLGVWNPTYWNSFPGEGEELRLWELFGKWAVSFQ